MTEHLVETCPDDLAALKLRLDELASEGAEIVSVVWQTNRAGTDQAAAYDARGSFVIIARTAGASLLRAGRPAHEEMPGTPVA